MLMSTTTCETIHMHHPDCECEWCRASVDQACGKPAVATCFDGKRAALRVCNDCAEDFHFENDVYRVVRDDGRPVVAS